MFTPVKNNRFEVLVPQEICNVKPAFNITMVDSDTESAQVPPPQNHGRVQEVGFGEWNQPESEAEGCPSEQESLEDNESEQAAEEEDVECREPIQDILFVPERRSMATGFESLDMVDFERVFEVRAFHEVCPRIHERGISRRHEDQFGGDQEGAVGKQCGDHHMWMEIVHVVAEDVTLQTTLRRTCSAQEVRRKVGGIQCW